MGANSSLGVNNPFGSLVNVNLVGTSTNLLIKVICDTGCIHTALLPRQG